uniref:Uncharacterized protein n=1 Tax=Meloidogyne enterolobii TaxID=390850 RepID=A0A6V7U4T7_MELEN|nr:unnamed protein product [Meloidogyne enterolobii]
MGKNKDTLATASQLPSPLSKIIDLYISSLCYYIKKYFFRRNKIEIKKYF